MLIFAAPVILSSHMFLPVFADPSLGVLNFKKIMADDGKKYAIGEVQNNDSDNNIESVIYFGNSNTQYTYGSYIGLVGHGMAMPFKVELPGDEPVDLDAMRVDSQVTLAQPDDLLTVDYSALHMDHNTHAISGILRNSSPIDAYHVRVFAIAMDAHAKVLDVTESEPIYKIPSNGSAPFTLVPLRSVARDVSYYSCFVPGQLGENYTMPAENGTAITFQISSDGEVKNVRYDKEAHSIDFDVEGVFPQGGWAEVMVLPQPESYSKFQSLGVTLNDQNATQSISSVMTVSQDQFKHVSFLFPFGKNAASVRPVNTVPEFGAIMAWMLPAAMVVATAASSMSGLRFMQER